jgi:cytoskeletal protein CcmA (bactofilin family)
MFTRNASVEPKALDPRKGNPNRALNVAPRPNGQLLTGEKSVIGNDLRIIGERLQIITQGALQVDGEIKGDVRGAEVIVGEKGKVTGMVAAERVIVRGEISGVICGLTVALQSSSRVNGDIHHMSLNIEQGAYFEGRSRRPSDAAELNSIVEARASGQPQA